MTRTRAGDGSVGLLKEALHKDHRHDGRTCLARVAFGLTCTFSPPLSPVFTPETFAWVYNIVQMNCSGTLYPPPRSRTLQLRLMATSAHTVYDAPSHSSQVSVGGVREQRTEDSTHTGTAFRFTCNFHRLPHHCSMSPSRHRRWRWWLGTS